MQQGTTDQQPDKDEKGATMAGHSGQGTETALPSVSARGTARAASKKRNVTAKEAQTSTRGSTARKSEGFTAEERAAMRETARERKAPGGENELLAKIAEMPESDRSMAERIHAIIMTTAPDLAPRTWYGMPAYAKDGNILCYFRSAEKFKTRYATLGFSDKAKLDDGTMWPTDFALTALTDADEARIAALVRRAVS